MGNACAVVTLPVGYRIAAESPLESGFLIRPGLRRTRAQSAAERALEWLSERAAH
jgi:hypothetical protein